ncbi:phage tail tube protein [Pararhodobacter zhoushanensis]|uniref:phage tail tube protein n=1 Tax=Pararhodobacter zhoushanensis TaxID=2479545 RepID=UPI000F8C69C5|nr:phage tail tube protein [Pararhodobacter zhoushanensis]
MTETAADIGYDSEVGFEATKGSGTYTALAEIVSIGGMQFTREFFDATHLKSDDRFKEYVLGLFDTGSVPLTLNFAPSASDVFYTQMLAAATGYQLTFPNGVMMRFVGAFESYTTPTLENGIMRAEAVLKRTTGKPTLHAAV